MKHIDVFISREGSEKQELGYATQMVSRDVADRILEQLRYFKQWVQSLSMSDTTDKSVPFIFVGFAKTLEKRDLK